MADSVKQTTEDLSRGLQTLHRDLLMLEAARLERLTEQKLNPYQLLNASLNNPELAWLGELSALIVFIDVTVDETPNPGAETANVVADRTLALLEQATSGTATPFWAKYTEYLSQHPDLILQHARLKEQASSLKPKM